MRAMMIRSLSLACLAAPAAWAAEYYVSGTGSDGNPGNQPTAAGAYRTLGKAAGKVAPGDTVWMLDGIYAATTLTASGTTAAWISWKAYPGHAPELQFNGWTGLNIRASYQLIDGLTVTGPNDSLTLAQAEADYDNASANGLFNGTGINVDCRSVTAKYHHITVRNSTVRACSGGGIQCIQADYITVEDCLISGNAWYGRWAQSGISLYQLWSFDGGTGYRNIIRRNTLVNNRALVKWKDLGRLSDGNGLIIDDSKNTQNGSTLGAYPGRTLVCDNLTVNNGGSGIHAYESEHVDIVGNTAYQNGQIVGYPEIYAGSSNDVRIIGNIMYAMDGGKANANSGNSNVTYDYNIYWHGTTETTGAHDVTADPQFISPDLIATAAGFRLRHTSPAVDSGAIVAGATQATDHDDVARPQGSAIDRGAFERQNLPPTISDISDRSTAEDTATGAIPCTIGDTETAAGSLTLGATSSDTTLVPDGAITLSGSGASRTILITPAANRNGSTTITLTVTDGAGASAVDTFVLTVSAVNDPPVNTTVPTISGSATVGQTLGANHGSWSDPDGGTTFTYAYRWQRADDASGTNRSDIAGATGASYVLQPGDAGTVIRVLVTAIDTGAPGSASANAVSDFTATIASTTTMVPVIGSSSALATPTPTLGGGCPSGATIRIHDDGVLIATITATGTTWTWTADPPLATGSHQLTVTAQTPGLGESAPSSAIAADVPPPTAGTSTRRRDGGGSGGSACGAGGLTALLLGCLAMVLHHRNTQRPG
jgi:hypothetical protein